MKNFLTIAAVVLASFVRANLKVLSPSELSIEIDKSGDGLIPSSLGNFGHIEYGAATLGRVVKPVYNLNGCKKFSKNDFPNIDKSQSIFVLVHRGGCNNPIKVKNIQEVGGRVALISDTTEENLEDFVMEDSGFETNQVQIPAYMIDHDAAVKISKQMEISDVYLKSELTIKNSDDKLEIGLFISSTVDVEPSVMETFARLAFESATTAHESAIELHIHTFACPLCPDFIKVDDCVSNGNYCVYFPKRNDYWIEQKDPEDLRKKQDTTESEFTGRELLLTTLQEKCLHSMIRRDVKQGNLSEDSEEQFFQLASNRLKLCNQKAKKTAKYAMECLLQTNNTKFSMYQKQVDDCVANSFEKSGDQESENSILAADRLWARQKSLSFHPTVTINDFSYRGAITYSDLTGAICAAFGLRPTECDTDRLWREHTNPQAYEELVERRYTFKVVFICLSVVAMLSCIVVVVVSRVLKRRSEQLIQRHVHVEVEKYFVLPSVDRSEPRSSVFSLE